MEKINISLSSQCVVCNETISNPICPGCLTKRMKLVVKHYNPELAKNIVAVDFPGETKCLFCGDEMGLCAHCFTRDTYDYLLENDKELAEVFLTRFDFELRRDVY